MSAVNCLKRPCPNNEGEHSGNSFNQLSMKDFKMHEFNLKASELSLEKEKNIRKLSRNESEKLRRDKLNMHILELAKIVPLVTNVNKKIDKSTILRLAVNYLRVHHDLVKRNTQKFQWRPKFLNNGNLGGSLLESLDSFLFVVSQKGTVNYISESITDILGHTQVDMLGHSIYNLVHQEDQELLKHNLQAKEGENPDSEEGSFRSFDVRMLNVCSKQQVSRYDTIRVVGRLKRMPRPCDSCNQRISQELPKPEVCLVAMGKLICMESFQTKELAWKDPCYTQWITQHTLDGKILYSDQRGSWLTGYFSKESKGLSPYDMMHPQDVQTIVKYHGLLLKDGEIPSLTFRMFAKGGETLYICSTSHMVIDMWTGKPKSIISLQVLLKPDDGRKKLKEQNEKIAALEAAAQNISISDKSDSPDTSQVSESETAISDSPADDILNTNFNSPSVILDTADGDIDTLAGTMLEIQSSRKTSGNVSPRNHITSSTEHATMNSVIQTTSNTAHDTHTNGFTSVVAETPYTKLRRVVTSSTTSPDLNGEDKTLNGNTAIMNRTDFVYDQHNTSAISAQTVAAPRLNNTKLAELLSKPVDTGPLPMLNGHSTLNEDFHSPLSYKDNSSPASSSSYQDDVFSQTSITSPEQTICNQDSDPGTVYTNGFTTKVLQSIPQKPSVQTHIQKLMELEVKRHEHEKALEQLQMEYDDQVRLLTELNTDDKTSQSSPPYDAASSDSFTASPQLSNLSTATMSESSLSPRQSPSSTVLLSPVPKTNDVYSYSLPKPSQSAVNSYPLLHNLLSNGVRPAESPLNAVSDSDDSGVCVSSTVRGEEPLISPRSSNGSYQDNTSLSDNELLQSILTRNDVDLNGFCEVSSILNKQMEDDLRVTNVIGNGDHLFNLDVNSFDFDL